MKGEVLTLIVLLFKIYVCEAETAIYGESKELQCNIMATEYEWHKKAPGGYVTLDQTKDPNQYFGTATTKLTIKTITWNNNGEYRCLGASPSNYTYGEWIQLSVTGSWSIWSGWSECSVSCGTGLIKRSRVCTSGSCLGDTSETQECTLNCQVDGGWSSWNNWEACTVTCGTGQQHRRRECNNPLPAHGGDSCPGVEFDNRECTLAACAVDGGWSVWNTWEACTVTCGSGQQYRRRYCNNPLPAHGGDSCQGGEHDYRQCTLAVCPVDGGWASWNSWGPCNVTCGNGQQRRRRFCNNPAPENGGTFCQGEEYDYFSCTVPVCPVNGGWSSWISGACNATCGIGEQTRKRYCNNPSQANGGADCQGEEDDLIACALSECAEQQSGNTPLVVGTVIGVLVIVILLVTLVTYAKRRWHNSKKEPDYEISDMTQVKAHIYGETHANHAYQNDQHNTAIQVTTTDNYSNEAQIVERYDVSDLTKRYHNRDYFQQSLRAEFKILNDSTDNPKQSNSPYEIVNTGLRQDVNKFHLDSSALDVIYTNNVSILLELPQKNLIEQFWTIVDSQCIDNIILLANGNDKVSEFYPILDDILRINNFEIYLDSAERMNKNIMFLTFNLQNKTTQSIRQIRMFKTNVSEYPTVQTLCLVMDKASEIRGAPALIISSKTADLSVCAVLTVCLNVIYAIKNGSLFSVLENARMVIKTNSSVFKDFDDYELCYKVIKHYLEDVHTYDCIE